MENFKELLMESLAAQWEQLAVAIPKIGIALIVFILFVVLSIVVRRSIRRIFLRRMDNILLGNFLLTVARVIILLIGFAVALKIIGLGGIAGGLIAGAGVGAFIIGFAFKDIGENFLAGTMMAFSRPFKIGDTVEINGVVGNVVNLDLRNTQIKTHDGKDVYIPNGTVIKNNLYNFTIDGYLRFDTTFGIDQDDDYDRAMEVILRTVTKINGVLKEPKAPKVWLSGTDNNSVHVRVHYWIDTFDKSVSGLTIKSEVLGKCIKALVNEGFYLPNTILELKNYKTNVVQLENKS